MNGKKKSKANSPEQIKDLGNKAFAAGKYNEAIDLYSQAI